MKQKDQIRTQLQKNCRNHFNFYRTNHLHQEIGHPPRVKDRTFFWLLYKSSECLFYIFSPAFERYSLKFQRQLRFDKLTGNVLGRVARFVPTLSGIQTLDQRQIRTNTNTNTCVSFLVLWSVRWPGHGSNDLEGGHSSWVFHERSFSWSSEVSSSLWSSVSKVTSLSLPIFSGQAGPRSSSSPVSCQVIESWKINGAAQLIWEFKV